MKSATPWTQPFASFQASTYQFYFSFFFLAGLLVFLFIGVSLLEGKKPHLDSPTQAMSHISSLSSTSSFALTMNKSDVRDLIVPFLKKKRSKVAFSSNDPYVDKWESFQAYFNDRKELFIHWSTTSNYPTDYFEIEKGRTLGTYTVFGKIESIRNPGMLRLFSFVDTTMQKGSTYYRIKKIKPNGDSTFSKVLQVHIP